MYSIVIFLLLGVSYATGGSVADQSKIVGGYAINITAVPYQLQLLYQGRQICGASIISARWVLTAAHCLKGRPVSSVSFRAGTNDRNSGGIVYSAEKITMHPSYDSITEDYDFALVQILSSFDFTIPGIKYIVVGSIPPPDNALLIVSGWGTTLSGGNSSSVLLAANVNKLNSGTCNEQYQGSITSRMMCASATGKDSCQGDSGGPLVYTKTNQLIGVVSWGMGCADPRYAGVYSNIPAVRIWIYRESGV